MTISRGQMKRQLRKGGGIMNVASREKFGLGSKLKRAIRKVIPNEVSKVASAAAPFVAPFNPALAAGMAGIGSFDQTGSISDALKRGALTYGGGQAARYIGGAGFQQNPFTEGGAFRGGLEGFKSGFSSPLGEQTGLGKFIAERRTPVPTEVSSVKGVGPEELSKQIAETGMDLRELGMEGLPVEGADPGTYVNPLEYKQFAAEPIVTADTEPVFSQLTKQSAIKAEPKILDLIKQGNYGEAAAEAGKKGIDAIFYKEGKGGKRVLDKTAVLAAGSFGLSYLDAKKLADEAGVELTEEEYDEATKTEKKEEYAGYLENFFKGRKEGGRIEFAGGGNRMLETYRMLDKAIEDGNMDLVEELKSILRNEFAQKLAKGGRANFGKGGSIAKAMEMGLSKEGALEAYNNFLKLKDEGFEMSFFDYISGEMFAEGGRVELAGGSGGKKKYGKGIEEAVKQIDPLQKDFGGGYKYKGGIGGGASPFSKSAISFLFRTLGKSGGKDRKYTMPDLYRILNNPGKFPEDEAALAAFLKIKGYREGGRAELAMGSEVPVRENKAGIAELDYRQSGGFVPIGIKEKADDVPAMLSKNEFVMTADAVRGIGNGDVERGAEKLYNVMKQAEKVGKA